MDARHFDRLSRCIGATTSRRAAMAALIGAGLAGGMGESGAKGKKPERGKRKTATHGKAHARVGAEATCASPGHGQNLAGCDFTNQDLEERDLASSMLKGAIFRGANLCGATLRASQLKNADFRGFAEPGRATILYKADLSLSSCGGAQFNDRTLSCGTKLCNGSISNRDCPGGIDPADLCCNCDGPNQFCDHGTCRTCDVCISGCPYTTVQAAVDAAASGATIAICPGTYQGRTITIGTNLTLIGAGSGAGGTMIDGSVDQGNTGHVQVQRNAVATLRDLTISGKNSTSSLGGGIAVIAGSRLTLTRVHVTNNQARIGGGIANSGSLLLEAETVVTANTATSGLGGGIFNSGTVTLWPRSDVSGNTPTNCVNDVNGTGCP
ncbi:MAG: pentapeptide repeat-containing protein [Thermomicrobiales bacterium]